MNLLDKLAVEELNEHGRSRVYSAKITGPDDRAKATQYWIRRYDHLDRELKMRLDADGVTMYIWAETKLLVAPIEQGTESVPKTITPKPGPMTQKPKARKGAVLILTLILIAMLGVLWWGIDYLGKGKYDKEKWTRPYKSNTNDAISASKECVKEGLNFPLTAEFPRYGEEVFKTSEANVWIVKSYVTAQNAFGVPMRANYEVKVKIPGEYQYQCLEVNID